MTVRTLAVRLGAVLVIAAILAVAGAGAYRSMAPEPQSPQEVAHEAATGLRCPTCQGLSVADSPAPMAVGMRKIISERAAAGKAPDEIQAYFVARYGEWILLAPPRRGLGWLVWLVPGAVVLAGAGWAALYLRRRNRTTTAAGQHDSDLVRAREVYTAYRSDGYLPDNLAASEQVQAALDLLESIDTEADLDPVAADRARDDALRRLARLLTAHLASGGAVDADADAADVHGDAAPALAGEASARVWRRAVYAGTVVAFAAVLVGMLAINVGDRGADGVPTGQFAEATPTPAATDTVEELRALSRQRPRDPAVWLALGKALDAENRLGKAYLAYRRGLDLEPGNDAARRLTAWTLIRGGSPSEALDALEPLTRDAPDDPENVLLTGLAEFDADRPTATTTLRRYLELDPDGPMAPQVRALLARARDKKDPGETGNGQ